MPAQLLLAPVGAGKTEWVLDQLAGVVNRQPLVPIWILLPTRRQEDAFRQRLVERSQSRAVYFNIHFFNFYSLYAYLLDRVGKPQRELDDTARLHLLRSLLTDLQREGQLQVFHKIADKPGFARIIADFIYELKGSYIYPENFQTASTTPKDHDLLLIYSRYQAILQQYDLVDREGEGWVALEEVEADLKIGTDVALLLVDGFDQFNPLQTQLLSLLAGRAQDMLITLPAISGREKTVGRRFDEALRKLQADFAGRDEPLHIRYHQLPPESGRQAGLRHISENGFVAGVQPIPSNGCLNLIEAPDPSQEARAVLRQAKNLLLTTHCQPDDVLIAVRDWERYAGSLAAAARDYEIPIALHFGDSLANNPAIIALLNVLELARNRFRRRDLLDALRTPYFQIEGLSQQAVDLLEQISISQVVTGDRAFWLEAVQLAAQPRILEDDEETEAPLLELSKAQELAISLSTFFDAVTPPPQSTIGGYITWIENLIGRDVEQDLDEEPLPESESQYSLHLLQQVRNPSGGETLVNRDLIAMQELKKLLRSLFASQNLFTALDIRSAETIDWVRFLHDLKASIRAAKLNRSPGHSGKILATSVTDARGLPHRHVFILGLSEGVFPAAVPEDPLYLDSERLRLTRAGVPLETQAERAADEGLFYELVSLAQETLTLSRPTTQNGAPWPESHLWRAICDLFSDTKIIIEHNLIRPGSLAAPEKAASRSEVALVVAAGLSQSALTPHETTLYNWLLVEHPNHWQQILSGQQIEFNRLTRRDFDRYSGRLESPVLRDWVRGELSSKRVWSASQLNDYGMCGFRFFSKRLLKLEQVEEPEEGMDAAQLGTLNHEILEKTYRQLTERNLIFAPEYAEEAVSILQQVADQVLEHAPRKLGFRASALWEQEKITRKRKLEALVRLDFSDKNPAAGFVTTTLPRQPYRQEVPLNQIDLPIDDTIGSLRVTGYIDRMDRVGDRVIVVDYKTGSTTIPTKEMQRGRNFQMMLYLLAGQLLLERDPDPDAARGVAGGFFWHLVNQKSSGTLNMDDDADREALEQARKHVSRHIQAGRDGDFPAHPNHNGHGPCSHYCEFSQFCRVSIMKR